MRTIDTQKIKAFMLVAKYKNFSKAAEEISYTPSSFSHIADSLENELGLKLFIRSRKGVDLTDEGKKLYNKFEALLSAEKEIYAFAKKLSKETESRIRIGAYSSVALHLLPEILNSFKKIHPEIKPEIIVDDYMEGWIENNTVDIIFADEQLEGTTWKPLMRDEFVAVVPENEFLYKKEIELSELYSFPLIYPTEKLLEEYLDFSLFKEVIPVKSIENSSVLYMVREKIGVTILPAINLKNAPTGVKVLNLTPKLARTIGIIYKNKNISASKKKFIRHTEEYLSNF